LDLLTYSIYIFVSLTRLFLNLYTAHSDVGGTPVFIYVLHTIKESLRYSQILYKTIRKFFIIYSINFIGCN
jgi:hypothetical protein